MQEETVWLSQKQLAELFQTSVPNINMHIKNIFDEGELRADSVIKDFLITAADGKNYRTKLYNLDLRSGWGSEADRAGQKKQERKKKGVIYGPTVQSSTVFPTGSKQPA